MVPNGAIVTYSGKWPIPKCFFSPLIIRVGDFVGKVTARLLNSGLAVRDSRFTSEGFLVAGFPAEGTSITLQIQVQNQVGFGSPQDIISIVRHEVYQEFCAFPLSDSIPFQQNPGGGQTGTGQPAPSGPNVKACAGALNQNGNWDIGCWVSSLTNQGMWAIGLVAIGLLTLVVLLPAQSVRVIRAAQS